MSLFTFLVSLGREVLERSSPNTSHSFRREHTHLQCLAHPKGKLYAIHLCHQWVSMWLVVIREAFVQDISGLVEQECARLSTSVFIKLMTYYRKINRQYHKDILGLSSSSRLCLAFHQKRNHVRSITQV